MSQTSATATTETKLVTDAQLKLAAEKGIEGITAGMAREEATAIIREWCLANPKPKAESAEGEQGGEEQGERAADGPATAKQWRRAFALQIRLPKGCSRRTASAIFFRHERQAATATA